MILVRYVVQLNEEENEEYGPEYAAFGPGPHSVGVSEAEADGVYVEPLAEGQEQTGSEQNKPLPLCERRQGHEGHPCGRYVCSFPMGCFKEAVHWAKKYAKKITETIVAGISAAVIGGVTFVATVGCAGATAEDPLLEFDCYKIGTFGASLTVTTFGLAVAPWIHHGHSKRR